MVTEPRNTTTTMNKMAEWPLPCCASSDDFDLARDRDCNQVFTRHIFQDPYFCFVDIRKRELESKIRCHKQKIQASATRKGDLPVRRKHFKPLSALKLT